METQQSSQHTNFPRKDFIVLRDIPFFMQISKIRCGSYTTEWVARAVGTHPISSNRILPGPVWFDMFRPILPSKMRFLFKLRGLNSVEVDVSKFTDTEKIDWIKREISLKRKPPALLIRTRTMHWIAIGGYDDERRIFYTYNPLYGSYSTSPDFPIGNSSIGYDELIKVWSGRFWLKYRAVVINTPDFPEPIALP